MTPACACHGLPIVCGNRCAVTGHRQPVNGVPPIPTRYFPPPIWLAELAGRWRARRAGP